MLLLETIHVKPQYRGYGIGLLAVDGLIKRVETASSAFGKEGLVVAKGKLTQHWQLLGMEVLMEEKKERCSFLAYWMGDGRPAIVGVVSHLFTAKEDLSPWRVESIVS